MPLGDTNYFFKEITLTNLEVQPSLTFFFCFFVTLETKQTKCVVSRNRRVFNSENSLIDTRILQQRKHAMQQKSRCIQSYSFKTCTVCYAALSSKRKRDEKSIKFNQDHETIHVCVLLKNVISMKNLHDK